MSKEKRVSNKEAHSRVVPLSELTQNSGVVEVTGNPPVQLYLAGLTSVVPEWMMDRIGINVDLLAGVARFGGLKEIHFSTEEPEEEVSIQVNTLQNSAATARGVGVRRKALEPTIEDLDGNNLFTGIPIPHGGRWDGATLPLVPQDIQDGVLRSGGNNVRNANAWTKVLNQQSMELLSHAAIKHLMQVNMEEKTAMAFAEGLGQSLIAWGVISQALDHIISAKTGMPGFLDAARYELIYNTALFGTSNVLAKVIEGRRGRNYRVGEFGSFGPEVIRSGVMKGLELYSKLPGRQSRVPFFVTLNPSN